MKIHNILWLILLILGALEFTTFNVGGIKIIMFWP